MATYNEPDEFVTLGDDIACVILRPDDVQNVIFEQEEMTVNWRHPDGELDWNVVTWMEPAEVAAILNGRQPTPPPTEQGSRELKIVKIVRGETKNSGSPMWRCYDADDEQVNVFEHENPDIDNTHFPDFAGVFSYFLRMGIHDTWENIDPPIRMFVERDGKYNKLLGVVPGWEEAESESDDAPPANTDILDTIRESSPTAPDPDFAPPGDVGDIPF